MNKSFLIAVAFLTLGFFVAYDFFDKTLEPEGGVSTDETIINPFSLSTKNTDSTVIVSNSERLVNLENTVERIQQQLQKIESTINEKEDSTSINTPTSGSTLTPKNIYASSYNQRIYNVDNLIRGGIDSIVAEEIVRRKNSIELKRLELQDHAARDNYLNTQRYMDELEQINRQDISLREELGEQRYDEYLYNSKQNNRVQITTVMFGSAAEQTGIENGDIVLSYDNKRIFTWQELKDATAEGELGEYVSLTVSRNGTIYSFSVPRGALGMELGATRLTP